MTGEREPQARTLTPTETALLVAYEQGRADGIAAAIAQVADLRDAPMTGSLRGAYQAAFEQAAKAIERLVR